MCEGNIPLTILSKHDINIYLDLYEKFVNSIKEIMTSSFFSQENNTYEKKIIPFNRLNGILILYSDIKSLIDLNYKKLDQNRSKLK